MADSTNLLLPYVEAAQAQKHVTVNEGIRLLDALVRTRVEEQGLTTPPVSPADGTLYIPGSGATGAWSAWDFNLAYYVDGAWQKIVPKVGWIVYDIDQAMFFMYVGAPLYWTRMFAALGFRELLLASRTYYVNSSTGSNSNNGLTSGAPFLTMQKAVDVVFGALDLGGFDVVIQLQDGTFTGGVGLLSPQVGAGNIIIRGNTGTPGNVIVNSATGFLVSGYGAKLQLEYLDIGGGSCTSGLIAQNGGLITIGSGIRFAACTAQHMAANFGGVVSIAGNYTINGGGTTANHANAAQGTIGMANRTVTISAAHAFSTSFVRSQRLGLINANGASFTGAGAASCTGSRYDANSNGVIYTNGGGASFFPGNAAGSTATGGQYV